MRVLVADKFGPSGIAGLHAHGCEVVYNPDLAGQALAEAIRTVGPAVLVVGNTRVAGPMIEGSTVSLIVRAGAGLNAIDLDGAKRLGIAVASCPGKNAIAVAELTIGLMVALDRRIPENLTMLRAGQWDKKEFSNARGLYGRTLGILGFGRIGEEVARRAQAFGMLVIVWSRRFSSDAGPEIVSLADRNITVVRSLEELASRSDVLSVHVALTPDTHRLVGREILSRLRPGSLFVNTARADVVDQVALAVAVKTQALRVALDVYAGEPPQAQAPFHDPLLDLPGVIGTHHIGGSTDQAQEAIAQEVIRIIRDWSKDEHHDPHL